MEGSAEAMSTPSGPREQHKGGAGPLWAWEAAWSVTLEGLNTVKATALEVSEFSLCLLVRVSLNSGLSLGATQFPQRVSQ